METTWETILINTLIGISIPILGIVGTMATAALNKLRIKWHLEGDEKDQAKREAEYTTALNVGVVKIAPLIRQYGWNSPQVVQGVLNTATDYFKQRFPDRVDDISKAAQSEGVFSTTEAVKETLSGRLPDAITQSAASPATPDIKPVEPLKEKSNA